LRKTAVDWVKGSYIGTETRSECGGACYIAGVDAELPLMKVIITFTVCCNNLWKSKFMALEKPGKLKFFFSYIVATLASPLKLVAELVKNLIVKISLIAKCLSFNSEIIVKNPYPWF